MNVLPLRKQVEVISCLVDGASQRATSRITGVNRGTVSSLALRVGSGCAALHDQIFRGLNVSRLQLDEAWSFVAKKQRRVTEDDPAWMGDNYLFLGLCSTSKALISYRVGQRNRENTVALCDDLSRRVVNHPMVSMDAWPAYPDALERAFGSRVDFGVLTKHYGAGEPGPSAARRYSPGRIIGVDKAVVRGEMDEADVCTSHIERANLTLRGMSKRFTRLGLGFSKRPEHHAAAVSLFVASYNLCWVHSAVRMSPAMAVGAVDALWSVEDLVLAALSVPDAPSPIAPPRRSDERAA